MTHEELLQGVDTWVERGWLRPLDRAFMRFLRELDPGADALFLLAATLASHQLGRGHICLDLEATLAAPDETLSLPPEGESGAPLPDLPSRILAGRTLEEWGQRVDQSSLVASGSGNSPLVFVENLLYLRRYWRYEQEVARSILDRLPQFPPAPENVTEELSRHTGMECRYPVDRDGTPQVIPSAWAVHRIHAVRASPRTSCVQIRSGRICPAFPDGTTSELLNSTVLAPEDLKERLEALFPRRESSTEPDWQKIACALATRGMLTVITGGPGTGKTTTVVRLLALLQGAAQAQGRKLRIRLAAPTGKAAARLTESIGKAVAKLPEGMGEAIPTEATTLHRLLGSRPDTRHFRHHADNPLHADLVVIDEASMIDLEMMAALLAALRPETRLVLLGDKDQLASVEAGSVLGDLCRDGDEGGYHPATIAWIAESTGEDASHYEGGGGALAQQIVTLRVSHRFGENSGIGRLAHAVNAGDTDAVAQVWGRLPPYPDIARIALRGTEDARFAGFVIEGGAGHFPAKTSGASVEASPALGYRHYLEVMRDRRPGPVSEGQAWDDWAGEVLNAFDRFQLLCALRRGPWGVEGLNRRIAEALHEAGLIGQTQGWYEGRPVLVTRNDYGLGLMNGDIGIALRFPEAANGDAVRLRVVFRRPDNGIKQVLPSRLTDIETVYAMTVHKSQGSEFNHVALVLPDRVNPILTRELVYTGITRARDWFSLLAPNPEVLDQAVARRVRRSGGLAQLLRKNRDSGPS